MRDPIDKLIDQRDELLREVARLKVELEAAQLRLWQHERRNSTQGAQLQALMLLQHNRGHNPYGLGALGVSGDWW